MSNKNRLAALVVRQSQDGTPLILAVVPNQVDVEAGDFTYTTPTCHGGRSNSITHIAEHVCNLLGIERADLVKECYLNLAPHPYPAKGKTYRWFMLEVSGTASINVNTEMVNRIDWMTVITMESLAQYMSSTRLAMFQQALVASERILPELNTFSGTLQASQLSTAE